MVSQVIQFIPTGPLNKTYQMFTLKEIEKHGMGINVFEVSGKGTKHPSFAYTCGFTSHGGKELILRSVHGSILRSVSHAMFNFLFQRHMAGHSLAHNQTVEIGHVAFIVRAPANAVEATCYQSQPYSRTTTLVRHCRLRYLGASAVVLRKDSETDDEEWEKLHHDIFMAAMGMAVFSAFARQSKKG